MDPPKDHSPNGESLRRLPNISQDLPTAENILRHLLGQYRRQATLDY